MTKLYYDDPLAAAFMAREFGVKTYITGECIDDGLKSGKRKYTMDWREFITTDSYHIFEKMAEKKRNALIELNLWPETSIDSHIPKKSITEFLKE